ncbi:MAG: lysylphosphatidylglycerol synthase transmembrane domain-containing protein [Candidatus Aenigmatarchaeota archaeon]
MPKKKYLIFVGIALLAALIYTQKPEAMLQELSKADLGPLIAGELLLLSIGLIKGLRFNMIIRNFGKIGLVNGFKVFYFGQLVNQGIASAIGDVSKMALLRKLHDFKTTKAVGSVITERMFDFTVLLIIGNLFLLSLPFNYSLAISLAFSTALVAALLALIFLPESLIGKLARMRKIHELITDFRMGVRSLGRKTLLVAVMTVLSWLAEGLAMMLIIKSLGVDVPFIVATSIMAISVFVGFASMIPGGIGTREAAMLLLYSNFGIAGNIVMASALMYRFLIALNDSSGYLISEILSRRTG